MVGVSCNRPAMADLDFVPWGEGGGAPRISRGRQKKESVSKFSKLFVIHRKSQTK